MDKKTMVRIFCIVLALILALGLIAPAVSAAEKDLRIEVVDIKEKSDSKTIFLEIENNTGRELQFGWGRDGEVIVTTDEGVYVEAISDKISRGNTELEITVEDCPGTVKQIELTNLHKVGSNGLPDATMDQITIYNAQKDKTSYAGNFSSQSNTPFGEKFEKTTAFIDVMFIVVPVLMVTMIVVLVVCAIRTARKNKKAMQQFAPFTAPGAAMHQQGVDLHNMAHQQAVDMHNIAHNQALDHQHMVDNQFNQQAVMPIDMGGFNPPPPPPPPTGF